MFGRAHFFATAAGLGMNKRRTDLAFPDSIVATILT